MGQTPPLPGLLLAAVLPAGMNLTAEGAVADLHGSRASTLSSTHRIGSTYSADISFAGDFCFENTHSVSPLWQAIDMDSSQSKQGTRAWPHAASRTSSIPKHEYCMHDNTCRKHCSSECAMMDHNDACCVTVLRSRDALGAARMACFAAMRLADLPCLHDPGWQPPAACSQPHHLHRHNHQNHDYSPLPRHTRHHCLYPLHHD